MGDEFELPVNFNGREFHFPVKLFNYGYVTKLEVDIENTKVIFEPDEERNWRALISQEELDKDKKLSNELLKAVAETISAITK